MATDPKTDAPKTEAPAQTQPQNITVNLVQPDRSAEGAQAVLDGRALEMDRTVPGGRYRVGDTLVDADGKPIKDKKTDQDD